METRPKAVTREQRLADQLDENNELKLKQMAAHNGEKDAIKMIPANMDKNIKIKENDEGHVHVLTITKTYNEATKTLHEEPRTIKIQPNNLDQMIAAGTFNVYDDVRVIHDPRPNKGKTVLKTSEPKIPTLPGQNDAALAAREQKLAERERAVEERLARLEKLGQQPQDPGAKLPEIDLEASQGKQAPSKTK